MRAFVKPYFLSVYDKKRIEIAKEMMKRSSIICAFGFSFGKSDETWLLAIREWLLNINEHHLVYNYFDDKKYSLCNLDECMDIEEERKHYFLKIFNFSGQEYLNVFEQVHIPIGENIFNFTNIETKIPISCGSASGI